MRALAILSTVVALLAARPAPALAVQASGSLLLVPSKDFLMEREEVDLVVSVQNTSSDTPGSGGTDPVTAVLEGPLTVKLSCLSPDCSVRASGALALVPVAPTGCVASAPEVADCVVGGPDDVLITIDPSGITLPPGGSVAVATVRIRVVDSVLSGLLLHAVSPVGGLIACASAAPSLLCARGDVSGSVALAFSESLLQCRSRCSARVRFIGDAAKPDKLELAGLLTSTSSLDPGSEPTTLELASELGPMLALQLPAGALVGRGTTYTYRDPTARSSGGIGLVSLKLVPDGSGAVQVRVQAFARELSSLATAAPTSVEFAIGDDGFVLGDAWRRRPYGWELTFD
ncbi:MAG: hypothetical protein AB1689_09195 [Thermodesulfobacteriota bacterium]